MQYICIANEFTINTTLWAVSEESVYIDDQKFLKVVTDKDGRFLIGIEKDGNIKFGCGVPQQVIDYFNHILSGKVDKEVGKSLIDAEYATGISYINNPNFLKVWIDSNKKLLFGIKRDGDLVFGCGVPTEIREYVNLKANIYNGSKILSFEKGNIDNSGNIPSYSNSVFANKYRTPLYLSSNESIKLLTSDTITDVTLFEYDESFALLKKSTVFVNSDISLVQNTKYVKVMVTNNKCPNITLFTRCVNKIEEIYNKRIDGNELSFGYEVTPNCGRDVIISTSEVRQYDTTSYYNSGLLMLPYTYKQSGSPTRIIIFCHGSADYQNRSATSFSSNYQNYFHWLRDEGFAIMDCYSHSTKYQNLGDGWACVDNLNCMVNAYNWVISNFNIRRDGVHVGCKSLGGVVASSLCYHRGIPVLSCGLLSPALSQISRPSDAIFGYQYQTRISFIQDMEFEDVNGITSGCLDGNTNTQDRKDYVIGNVDKLIGYEPYTCGMSRTNAISVITALMNADYNNEILKSERQCHVPTKIWIASDDENIELYPMAVAKIEGIKNACGVGMLRRMPTGTGGHHAVDYGQSALKVDSITTKLGVEYTNIPLAWVEMWQWFEQHD